MKCDSILRVTYRRTSKVEERITLTRERIVLAALELVATHGYGGTTMPMVAATAEVSTGLLYQYFPSKTDLFDEVFRQASQREIDACAAAAASESGAGTAPQNASGALVLGTPIGATTRASAIR